MKDSSKTNYMTRGKVHLIHPRSIVNERVTWCGLKLEDINNSTEEVQDCTCQKCLAYKVKPPIRDRSKLDKAIRHNAARNARIAERKK